MHSKYVFLLLFDFVSQEYNPLLYIGELMFCSANMCCKMHSCDFLALPVEIRKTLRNQELSHQEENTRLMSMQNRRQNKRESVKLN